MSQNENLNIDELLNSFLDGELDARRQTEVQRLINHDEQIAERLQSLRNCRRLVSSLPYAEAPDGMLENIKASLSRPQADLSRPQAELEEKELTLPAVSSVSPSTHRQRQGARHLFLRQLTTAIAMIGLVAVLAAVIYTIVAPVVTTPVKPVAVERPQPKIVAAVEKPMEFTGRLELKTSVSPEVAAFLYKAIEFSIPSDERASSALARPQESLTLNCSRQNLKSLLDDLDTIWDKIDSAVLFMDTGRPEGQIVIDAITPEQITEIAKQDNSQTQIKTAKFFAAMNSIAERSPGKEVLVAVDNTVPDLITIPKPVLTSNEKPVTKAADGSQSEQKVLLTIVVTGNE